MRRWLCWSSCCRAPSLFPNAQRDRKMPPDRGLRALAMLAFELACTSAFAGPPFLTDDPEPVDHGHSEVNLIDQETRATTGRSGSVSGEINVGCAAQTQCHIALPFAHDHRTGGPKQNGLGDVELGVKYRFIDHPDDGWSAAVYPTVDLPTGDADKGLGNGSAQFLLPLWVQRSVGAWRWDGGIARLINRAPGARDSWYIGALAQRSFGDRLSVGAELYRRTSTAAGVAAADGFNVGAIVRVAPHQNLLVSAGRGLTQADRNRCSTFVAYQLEL